MEITSLHYVVFIAVCLFVTKMAGSGVRWAFMLISSYIFYYLIGSWQLLLLLIFITSINYLLAIKIVLCRECIKRKIFIFGVAVNVAIFIGYKFSHLLVSNVSLTQDFLKVASPLPSPLEPVILVGVSFYVFQLIAYLSDVYLEKVLPEMHFGHFLLFTSFYPKILQGPIERASDLLPQLKDMKMPGRQDIKYAVLLFAVGLFLKVVLADNLAVRVDTAYADPVKAGGFQLLIAAYSYSFQIYYDFYGYMCMALGVAQLYGIRLSHNFNSPYLAISIADFWRRWHITLSRFLMDYIFIPLQLRWRQHKKRGTAYALLVTFLISGVWHGTGWNFIVWGAGHGILMIMAIYFQPISRKISGKLSGNMASLYRIFQVAITFNLLTFLWIFFRSSSLAEAWFVIEKIFSFATIDSFISLTKTYKDIFLLSFFLNNIHYFILFVMFLNAMFFKIDLNKISKRNIILRWSFYYVLIFSILSFNVNAGDFIYLKF
jgi:D-alanyl-lipoteichoic acid acyltransferase DltB (MBOAT superfamily)